MSNGFCLHCSLVSFLVAVTDPVAKQLKGHRAHLSSQFRAESIVVGSQGSRCLKELVKACL